ncbi:hypothetical protein SAMN04487950_3929 [Halogranum rubrum]|uniref:Uncharacterized protein n=1 Tax=Halogranum rubrum TaxID=553466 RepID=A0A1I4I2N8_9EURY|nr:hypothetical protein [Halogranum rubrum]SFL48722.1 hypothetical protein SAMN04487950_3929 [Halogranum rubrum]
MFLSWAATFDANEMYPELSESWLLFFRESLFVRTGLAALDPLNRCSGRTNCSYFGE